MECLQRWTQSLFLLAALFYPECHPSFCHARMRPEAFGLIRWLLLADTPVSSSG